MVDEKRKYSKRSNVDWFDEASGLEVKHNQRSTVSGKYWNEFKGKWCSKKSKKVLLSKGSIVIYDLSFYRIEEIKKDFGSGLYEKVALFISKLYQNQLKGRFKAGDENWVYWSRSDLDRFLTYKWKEVVDKLLELGKVEQFLKASRYKAGSELRYFKLNDGFWRGESPVIAKVNLIDARYELSIRAYYKALIKDRKGILKVLEGTLDKTSLIIDDIDVVIKRKWLDKIEREKAELSNDFISKREKGRISKKLGDLKIYEREYKSILKCYYDLLVEIQGMSSIDEKRGHYRLNTSDFGGRIVHLYSNSPREFRKYLRIEGEEVIEIDIRSSQPSFLYVLLDRGYLFKGDLRNKLIDSYPRQYLDMLTVVNAGDRLDFYNYMAIKLYGLGYAKNGNVRLQMKTLFYRIIFSNPRDKIAGVDKKILIIKLFGEGFYNFLLELSKHKLDLSKDHYKNLSKLLQKQESDLLNKVMERLEVPYLPLYDSLIVKKSDAKQVRAVFNDVFKELHLAHILKVK
jgi:hypothetical protein